MRSAIVIERGGWPLITTAGSRPDSMRATRGARVGARASAVEACGSGGRLLAESYGESNEELEAAAVNSANAAVRSIRSLAIVDLMGANRTTFECEAIRLVGRGPAKNESLFAEEIDEEFGNAAGFFVLQPVGGVGEGVEFAGVAVAEALVGHVGEKEGVALAPEDARGDVHGRVGEFRAITKSGAVPIDHGGQCAGFAPCGAVLGEIFGGERVGAAGTDQRADPESKIQCGECGFRQPGELKEKHVPTAAKLAAVCF